MRRQLLVCCAWAHYQETLTQHRYFPAAHQNGTTHNWKHVYDVARAAPDVESFLSQLNQSDTEISVQPIAVSASAGTDTAADVQRPQNSDKQEKEEVQQPAQPADYVHLSKDLAVAHSKDKIILVTWTNFHFLDFVENWITHLLELGTLPCNAIAFGVGSDISNTL